MLPELNSPEEDTTVEGSKDDEVPKLTAIIEVLIKLSSNKGAVRCPPPFEEDRGKARANVKTRSVADVGKSGNPFSLTRRNKSKTQKVKTRVDGPSAMLEGLGSGLKKSKKKKVVTPNDETTKNAHKVIFVNGEPQPPPPKVKQTLKKLF